MGRPTKLTPERQAIICEKVAVGMPLKDAAAAAGISYATLAYWRQRAQEGDDPDGAYSAFSEAVAQAEAVDIEECLPMARTDRNVIQYLERRYPDRFAPPRSMRAAFMANGNGQAVLALEIIEGARDTFDGLPPDLVAGLLDAPVEGDEVIDIGPAKANGNGSAK